MTYLLIYLMDTCPFSLRNRFAPVLAWLFPSSPLVCLLLRPAELPEPLAFAMPKHYRVGIFARGGGGGGGGGFCARFAASMLQPPHWPSLSSRR
jgi:hypothetical protein